LKFFDTLDIVRRKEKTLLRGRRLEGDIEEGAEGTFEACSLCEEEDR